MRLSQINLSLVYAGTRAESSPGAATYRLCSRHALTADIGVRASWQGSRLQAQKLSAQRAAAVTPEARRSALGVSYSRLD